MDIVGSEPGYKYWWPCPNLERVNQRVSFLPSQAFHQTESTSVSYTKQKHKHLIQLPFHHDARAHWSRALRGRIYQVIDWEERPSLLV